MTPQLSIEPSLSINDVDLPYGDFTQHAAACANRLCIFAPHVRERAAAVQHHRQQLSSNLRFRWEYHPGSELFVVYTDERDTVVSGFPQLKNRAFVVKITRLWQL